MPLHSLPLLWPPFIIEMKVWLRLERQSKMADGTSMPNPFRDEDIHDVLARSGYPCKRFPDTDRDSEWYAVNLETAINAIKAYKEGRTVLSSSEKVLFLSNLPPTRLEPRKSCIEAK